LPGLLLCRVSSRGFPCSMKSESGCVRKRRRESTGTTLLPPPRHSGIHGQWTTHTIFVPAPTCSLPRNSKLEPPTLSRFVHADELNLPVNHTYMQSILHPATIRVFPNIHTPSRTEACLSYGSCPIVPPEATDG
jgi:hypothetical protein